MIPVLIAARKVASSVPWQAWALLAFIVVMFFARSHWIGVGEKRCESAQAEAQAKADAKAAAQEIAAPVIAQEAREAVEPQIIERTRIIRETIEAKPLSCPSYDERVLDALREAEASANRVRQGNSADK